MRPGQWGLDAIGAPEAWAKSTGKGVVVAVLDTGVQIDHPDLVGNIWTNPDEIDGNGIDDDGNGFVDDIHGANMVSGGANVKDEVGHGTHIAGIIAARAHNGVGGTGIAPDATIMPVKVVNGISGNNHDLALGIRYAASEGAQILNVSINAEASGSELREAVQFASEQGVTVVASAGNDGRNIDAQPSYPASFDDAAVLGIGASTKRGSILGGTNRGAHAVDLAAPGASILSTVDRSRYELKAGTSMATPFAAGALALLTAARPDLSQAELRDVLLAGADRTPLLSGKVAAGLVDVGAAMHRLIPGEWGAPSTAARLRVRARSARAGSRVRLRWKLSGVAPVVYWRVTVDGRDIRELSSRARRVSVLVRRGGRHRIKVTGYDAQDEKLVRAARVV
jgi:subtilisin family serine protease